MVRLHHEELILEGILSVQLADQIDGTLRWLLLLLVVAEDSLTKRVESSVILSHWQRSTGRVEVRLEL